MARFAISRCFCSPAITSGNSLTCVSLTRGNTLALRTRRQHDTAGLLKREKGRVIGDNEPYSVTDASDYTIPVHGERRSLHHVAIEIRQDLIAEDIGQRAWGVLLARLLPQAFQDLTAAEAIRPASPYRT